VSDAGVNPASDPQGLTPPTDAARRRVADAGVNPASDPQGLTPPTDAAPPPHPGTHPQGAIVSGAPSLDR
jgi:hypothetical protein